MKNMATGDLSTPETPHLNSPVAYVHPKLTDRGSYVQRWKALRDRNRNLPKLDFNTKLAAKLQRQNTKAHIGLARSLTLDSMKLPSITNGGSIANGSIYTTKSNKETTTKKSAVQETESILSDSKTINGALSKSLPNVANIGTQETNKQVPNTIKHRYERIAHQKRLVKRQTEKKENQQLEQSGIYQIDINDEFDTDTSGGEMSQRFSKNTIGTILEHEALLSGRNSRQTRLRLQNDSIGKRSRRKKWRDDCKCMRCEIMHRQYEERDDQYSKWGIYPCQQHLARQKFYKQYFYDSD